MSASAPRQNAGGEGAEEAAAEGAATATPSRPSAAPASAPASEDDDSPLPLILGIVAVVLSAAALVVALRPRKTTAV